MIVAGIDPGASGALALVSSEGLVGAFPVPKVGTDIDFVAWGKLWGAHLPFVSHVWIEQVNAMPGQGVTSMFNFGKVYGVAIGLVVSAGVPFSFVRPQAWKQAVGIPNGSGKSASRLRASQVFPESVDRWAKVRDDGLAEAALIAYYGLQRNGAMK